MLRIKHAPHEKLERVMTINNDGSYGLLSRPPPKGSACSQSETTEIKRSQRYFACPIGPKPSTTSPGHVATPLLRANVTRLESLGPELSVIHPLLRTEVLKKASTSCLGYLRRTPATEGSAGPMSASWDVMGTRTSSILYTNIVCYIVYYIIL
jgi:hypothetical protein